VLSEKKSIRDGNAQMSQNNQASQNILQKQIMKHIFPAILLLHY
jgi:hypothetical protein